MPELKTHPIQAEILVSLLFKPNALFSELTTNELTNDHLSFHVNRLVSEKLIKKISGKYSLTAKGKEFANRFDELDQKVVKQAKNSVLVICVRQVKGKQQLLLQQRLKEPYYGYWGGVSGKINWGETAIEAAARELYEETGLKATLTLVCVGHKIDLDENDSVLEDKFFYVFIGRDASNTLIEAFQGGRNKWLTKEEIFDGRDIFGDVEALVEVISKHEKGKLTFMEKKYKEKRY
jgi:ADP-ribose pyrophosphatase YjhB (NUDIX family)